VPWEISFELTNYDNYTSLTKISAPCQRVYENKKLKCNKEKQRKKGKKTQATEKTQPAKEQTPPSEDHNW